MWTVVDPHEVPDRLVTQERGALVSEVKIPPAKTPISVDCAKVKVENSRTRETAHSNFLKIASQQGEFTAVRIITGDEPGARHPIADQLPTWESVVIVILLGLCVVCGSDDPEESIGFVVHACRKEKRVRRALRGCCAVSRNSVGEVQRP